MYDDLICVFGNGGAGKSVISLAIANYLTTQDKLVLILSPDLYQPMLPVFAPFEKDTYSRNKSIGELFLKGFTVNNTANLIGKIYVHPQNNNLGFLSYVGGDSILRYSSDTITDNKIQDLIGLLKKIYHFDYIIVDCNTCVEDCTISTYSTKNSLKKVFVMSPDNKGISYYNTRELFTDIKAQITVLNNCFPYSPYKEIQEQLGIKYVLPHSQNAYENYLTGGKFNFKDGFSLSIKQIVNDLTK